MSTLILLIASYFLLNLVSAIPPVIPEPQVSPPIVPEPRQLSSSPLPPAVVPVPRQSGCNSDIFLPYIGSQAVIQSQNFPFSYPNNANCVYRVRSVAGSRIRLICSDFNVEATGGCRSDALYLSPSGDSYFRDVVRECGQKTVLRYSTSNLFPIGFYSDYGNPFSFLAALTSYRYRCTVSAVQLESTTTVAPLTSTDAPATSTTSASSTSTAPTSVSSINTAPTSVSSINTAPTTAVVSTSTPASPTQSPTNTPSCSCGTRNEAPRIVGGAETLVHEFPWRCGLYSPTLGVFCGSTVISKNWVLTAAHCTAAVPNGAVIQVDCADHSISGDNETKRVLVTVKKIVQHAAYNSSSQDSDVSLLELETPLQFDRTIQPICLPYNLVGKNMSGTTVVASGWGATSFKGKGSDVLLKVDLPVLTTSECQEYYGSSVTNNMFCTYNPGKDTCQGDSGGSIDYKSPETGRYYNPGVVSWGVGCAGENQPGVYANVMNYLSWIEAKTGETFCKP